MPSCLPNLLPFLFLIFSFLIFLLFWAHLSPGPFILYCSVLAPPFFLFLLPCPQLPSPPSIPSCPLPSLSFPFLTFPFRIVASCRCALSCPRWAPGRRQRRLTLVCKASRMKPFLNTQFDPCSHFHCHLLYESEFSRETEPCLHVYPLETGPVDEMEIILPIQKLCWVYLSAIIIMWLLL